jgi:hypothetical protein
MTKATSLPQQATITATTKATALPQQATWQATIVFLIAAVHWLENE